MQTFLPYPSFTLSAMALDNKRLGKQRVEAMQILNILEGKQVSAGWKKHPAVLMWQGFETALINYYNACLTEWQRRGFKNVKLQARQVDAVEFKLPPFVGNAEFHLSHQSNLVRKKPEYYRKIFHDVPDNLPYIWMVQR